MTTTAIKAGNLIDGTGADPIKDAVVVIEDGTVKQVGSSSSVKIPDGADIIDASENTVMPGMMDLHIHLCMFNNRTFKNYRVAQWEVTPELQQMYALFHAQLCFEMGFTTLRDLGLQSSRGLMTAQMCAVRDVINSGAIAGPRLVIGGFTYMTGSHLELILPRASIRQGFENADGPWELRKLARTNLRHGCDVIKTCASGGGGTDKEEPDVINMTQEELNAIVNEAHNLHKRAAVHCFTPDAHLRAVEAGTDTIEHMVFHTDESLDAIQKADIWMTPTLAHRTDHAIEIRREIGTPEFVLKKMKTIQPSCFETFQACHKRGMNIALGTDMGYEPGMGTNAYEMEIYCDLGMSPMDAILTGTRNAGIALGRGDELGTLEPGKIADVVVVDGDPLANIKVLQERERILIVMKEGDVYIDRRKGHPRREIIHAQPDTWSKPDA